ncbi:MAG: YkvA family protein [Deltaproteobacteria bacterium]|jgi:uncharacterized membrane protein YkvA (DUF1232 family)|nr:YkvA family protein [Myxococcales bacterium]MDP3216731.1 YkvA family protein [Deltaproteobacteria bacterium]
MTKPAAPSNLSRSQRGVMALITSPRRLWRFLRDPNAPKLPKGLALLAVLYIVMPADIIPDVIPILGWLDDLGLTGVALGYLATKAAGYEDAEDVKRENEAKGGGEAIGVKPVAE